MAHSVSAEAEEILDREFKVLNHGFVRLVDYMGNDSRIVQAARVSYGEGTKSIREDAALIDYLLRHRHTSPFEQVVLTFHVKMPVFVARQWIRHRTARVNEISGRYSIMKDEFYVPEAADVALQSTDNKQGRSLEKIDPELASAVMDTLREGQRAAYDSYKHLVDSGIARELARVNLPLSLYTEWYWQIDLHNLFHFLSLRMESHAQKEIRVYAELMYELTKKVCPAACQAFERNQFGAVTFSKEEFTELRTRLSGKAGTLEGKALDRFEEKIRSGITL